MKIRSLTINDIEVLTNHNIYKTVEKRKVKTSCTNGVYTMHFNIVFTEVSHLTMIIKYENNNTTYYKKIHITPNNYRHKFDLWLDECEKCMEK